jgi:multisubunit Na+/H+ antiporter MnhG subunit
MSAKTYALWGGIILLVLGVIGLFARPTFIGLNTEIVETVIHLVAGAILVYGGTRGTDAQAASWAKIFGVLFVLVGIAGFIWPNLFGLFPERGLGAFDNIVHLIYGVLGWWAGSSYKPAM